VPLSSLCPGIRLTTEEKHGKPQSEQPSSPGTARCADLVDDLGLRGIIYVGKRGNANERANEDEGRQRLSRTNEETASRRQKRGGARRVGQTKTPFSGPTRWG
jgi:hypothetical protein